MGLRLAVALALGSVLLSSAGWLLWSNHSLRTDNERLITDNATLTNAVRLQKQATQAALANAEEWESSHAELQATHEELKRVEQRASAEAKRLRGIYAEHDLTGLALSRPGLVERRINRGSADVFRLLNEATTSGGGQRAAGAGGASGAADRAGSAPP